MPRSLEERFAAAMKHYEDGVYPKAIEEFSNLVIDFTLQSGTDAMNEIEKCMEMTIASYNKINPKTTLEILRLEEKGGLWYQFFHIMRQHMDYTVEADPFKVKRALSIDIPLAMPLDKQDSTPEGTAAYHDYTVGPYQAAVASAQGPREEMEDTHLATEIDIITKGKKLKKVQVFGVLDGHGGFACAAYVKEVLPEILANELSGLPSSSDLNIYNALIRSFIQIDKNWKELPFQQTEHLDYSGTTVALSMIFDGKTLWAANVGDSRMVLVSDGKAVQLSEEAKATVAKYEREIFVRGGEVQFGRVVGERCSLDMARSIGDIDQYAVSALPFLKKLKLDTLSSGDKYLILGCDGLWEVVGPQMAAEVCSTSNSVQEIAKNLEQLAFLRGTTDNVTVMVVKV